MKHKYSPAFILTEAMITVAIYCTVICGITMAFVALQTVLYDRMKYAQAIRYASQCCDYIQYHKDLSNDISRFVISQQHQTLYRITIQKLFCPVTHNGLSTLLYTPFSLHITWDNCLGVSQTYVISSGFIS